MPTHGVWIFLGKDADKFLAHLLRELRQVIFIERFDVAGELIVSRRRMVLEG